ncbi:MAG TPA: hypothetical protein PKX92_01615 [Edaphocola sp.]|nr:hypothetical protein [Edaphocola sp.]
MKKTSLPFILFLLLSKFGFSQVYNYKYNGREDHAGIQIDFNQNNNIQKGRTSTAFAPYSRIGAYLKFNFSPTFYFKGTLMLGNGNFSYRYPKTAKPISDTFWPNFEAGKHSVHSGFFEPEIALGHLFKVNGKHQIDIRLGTSLSFYTSKKEKQTEPILSSTILKSKESITVSTVAKYQTNRNESQWGVGNASLFIGYKRIHFNDFSDHFGIGVTYTHSFFTKNAGSANFSAYNQTYNYEMWKNTHLLSFSAIGIRLEYDLF